MDLTVIKQITDVIESVQGIQLLDVDPGESTNRTVVTFIGEPEPVKEAAFRAVQKRFRSSDSQPDPDPVSAARWVRTRSIKCSKVGMTAERSLAPTFAIHEK